MRKENKKIRIAYLINHFGNGGGTENQLANLIINMDRAIFEPRLFILKPLWEDVDLERLNCPVTFLDITSFASFKFPAQLFRFAKVLRDWETDIIQSFFFDARVIGALAGFIGGVKKVVASRRDFGFNLSNKRLFILRMSNLLVDHIITNANRVKAMVADKEHFNINNISTVYNGVELPKEHGIDPLEEAGIKLNDDLPIVGIVANLRPVKRIDRFLKVAAGVKNKQTQFVIIGWGPDPEKYRQMANELEIGQRTFMKHIVHDVDLIIKRFDVALLTSQSEGLSNALIEYCLCGKPALAFDIGGNAEIIEDGKTGHILDDDDIESMTTRLNELLENKQKATEMGLLSQERAQRMFSIKTMVTNTEDVYLKLVSATRTQFHQSDTKRVNTDG